MGTLSLGMPLLQLRLHDLKEAARNMQGTCSEYLSTFPHTVLLLVLVLLLLLLLLLLLTDADQTAKRSVLEAFFALPPSVNPEEHYLGH